MMKHLSARLNNINSIWFVIALTLLGFNFFFQLGFISDDSYEVHFRGKLILNNESLLHFLKMKILEIPDSSRIQWFGVIYTSVTYYFIQNALIIKFIWLSLIASNVYLLYSLIEKISKSPGLALLIVAFLPFLFQVRPWHDPLIAFTFMWPLMGFLILSSLLIFLNHLKKPNYLKLFFSFFLYFLACSIYEVPYFIYPVFFLVALSYKKNFFKAIKSSLPFLILVLFLICFILYKKEFTTAQNWRTDVNLQSDFWLAFFKQLIASLPFSFMTLSQTFDFKYSWSDLPLLFAFPFLFHKIFSSITLTRLSRFVYIILLLSGLTFLIFPAVLAALSGHQSELIDISFGYGYLPVYFQYFGIAIIFGILINKYASNFFSNKKNVLILVFISTILMILNYGSNKEHSLNGNSVFKYPRDLHEASIDAGFMDKISENDLILHPFYVPSDHYLGYILRLEKRLNVCDIKLPHILDKEHDVYKKCFGDGFGHGHNFEFSQKGNITHLKPIKNTWFVNYEVDRMGKTGFLYLAKIDEILIDSDTSRFLSINSKILDIFELTENGYDIKSIKSDKKIDMFYWMNNRANSYSTKNPSQYRKDFKLADYYFTEPVYIWIDGALPPEGNLIWTTGKAKLKIINIEGKTKNIIYSFTIFSPTGRKSTITINDKPMILMPGQEIHIKNMQSIGDTPFELNISSDDTYLDNGDPRKIVFGIRDYKQRDIGILKDISFNEYSNRSFDTLDGELSIDFSSGWSDPQDGHRWTVAKESIITFFNPTSKIMTAKVMFNMNVVQNQTILISMNDVNLENYTNSKPGDNSLFEKEITLEPGKNIFKITTDKDPISPGNGDIRKLGLSISNLNIKFNL